MGNSVNLIYIAASILFTAVVAFLVWLIYSRRSQQKTDSNVKRLAGMLNSKQQQAEIIIQSIIDGVIVIDMEGKINQINPAASKITGWEMVDALGIDVRTVVSLSESDKEDLAPKENPFSVVLRDKAPFSQTFVVTSRDKKKAFVSLVVSPIVLPKSNNIAGAVAILRDISAERAEEQRRADFISTASHEMRTHVAAIEGYLALALNDHVSQIDSKAREYLEKAHASTQSLGKLFQDLLTSAKAEDGRLVSHPSVVEIGQFLEQLTDSLRFAAEKKGLMLNFVVGANDPNQPSVAGGKVVQPLYYVFVDPERMKEVITNLFDNAVKYTPNGKISIGLTGDNDVVQFYIKDTGPGIPPEDVPHLFQKFYRVDSSATRTIGGTGLGLFICRKIVELYKGRIWVESKINEGSTFYINLPRLSSQKAAELQENQNAQQGFLKS